MAEPGADDGFFFTFTDPYGWELDVARPAGDDDVSVTVYRPGAFSSRYVVWLPPEEVDRLIDQLGADRSARERGGDDR